MGILAYSVAYSGLQNAQQRMNVANNNIANINTPFFRREVLNQSSALYLQQGYDMYIGTGVKSDSTSQIKDENMFSKEMTQQQDIQFSSIYKSHLSSVESLFNDINNQGLSSYVSSFNTSLNKLSINPTDSAAAQTVINSGGDLTQYVNYVNNQMNNEKQLNDNKLTELTNNVNSQLDAIQKLNYEIRMQGTSPDLMNQLDNQLFELNKLIPISVTDKYNAITITSQNVSLLTGNVITPLSYTSGQLQTATTTLSTTNMKSQMGALFEYSNKLTNTQNQFNTDITNYFNAFNTQHASGYNAQNTTGLNFFSQSGGNWNVGAQYNEIGYSDSINQLSNNKNIEILKNMSSTLSNQYKILTTDLSMSIKTQDKNYNFYNSLYTQTEKSRQELEGVSLEEETMKLTQAEQAYQANLKVIETANSMWNALISIRS